MDAGEFRFGHALVRYRFFILRDELWIVDAQKVRAPIDVLTPDDGDPAYPAVDPGRDIDPRAVRFSLYDQRGRAGQIPGREGDNGEHDDRDRDRRQGAALSPNIQLVGAIRRLRCIDCGRLRIPLKMGMLVSPM